MKICILLFGLSKCEYIYWHSKKKITIDYIHSYDNYKKYIFDYFKNKNYDIDVYFSTNILNDTEKNKLLKLYNPISYSFIKNYDNNIISRNKKLENVVDLCLEKNYNYDLVLITRFDLIFKKNFNESNINLNNFNLVSKLEKDNLICDNFYLFPYKYLKHFSKIIKKNINISNHRILKDIRRIDKELIINFILNENTSIYNLSFYKIVRNIN